MRIRIATSWRELEGMRSQWQALARAVPATMFQSFEWNLLAARIFANREAPYVVICENDSGAALIPACVRTRSRTISLLGEELFDYRDFLAAGDELALHAAWEKLADLGLPLEVTALRGRDACERWAWLSPEPFCGAPAARPGPGVKPKRSYVLRRLLRLGACVRQHGPANQELVHWIFERKAEQEGSLFADPLRRAFMLEAVQLPASGAEMFTLELETHTLAALVTFMDGGIRRFYTTYFDAAWAKHSPGFALLSEAAERTLSDGCAYDFMTGEQPYKMRLATSSVPLYRISQRRIEMRNLWTQESTLAA